MSSLLPPTALDSEAVENDARGEASPRSCIKASLEYRVLAASSDVNESDDEGVSGVHVDPVVDVIGDQMLANGSADNPLPVVKEEKG